MISKRIQSIAFASQIRLRVGLVWWLFCMMFVYGGAASWAAPAPRQAKGHSLKACVKAYKAKRFLQAAKCFSSLGKVMKPGPSLSAAERAKKGRLLRNAAVAYKHAANAEKTIHVASYLREQAVKWLDLYLQEKLCETSYRCRFALDLKTRIAKKIGYAQLAVVIDDPKGRVVITGYKLKREQKGDVSLRVRPGRFVLTVTYAKQLPKIRELVIKPNSKVISRFEAPNSKATVTAAAVGLYIAGAVLVAGGGITLGLGTVSWLETDSRWADPLTKMSIRQELETQRAAAQPMLWAGGGAVGLGVVLLLLGMAFHQPPSKLPKAMTLVRPLDAPPLGWAMTPHTLATPGGLR